MTPANSHVAAEDLDDAARQRDERIRRSAVMLAIAGMADADEHLCPDAVFAYIAQLIEDADRQSDAYRRDVRALLGIGACVWKLSRKQ